MLEAAVWFLLAELSWQWQLQKCWIPAIRVLGKATANAEWKTEVWNRLSITFCSKWPEIRLSYSACNFCVCICLAPCCPQNIHCCLEYYISISAGNSFLNRLWNHFSLCTETAFIPDSNCAGCIQFLRAWKGPKLGYATWHSPWMELASGGESKITNLETLSWKFQPGSCSPTPYPSPLWSPEGAEAQIRDGGGQGLEMAPSLHEQQELPRATAPTWIWVIRLC